MSHTKKIEGEWVESQIIDIYSLRETGTSFDAALKEVPIEIKSTHKKYCNNRTGRFRLYKTQHERLIEANGFYIFALVNKQKEIISHKPLSGDLVDQHIEAWNRAGSKSNGEFEYQLSWKKLFQFLAKDNGEI